MPKELDKPSTEHRVSRDLVKEILIKNQSLIKESSPDDDRLEHDSELRNNETQFREYQLKDAQIDRYKQDTELRKAYADKVFKFMIGYTLGMFFIVFLSGWKFPIFHIETVPLTTLIGSSFASTAGLVYLVVKGLFPIQRDSSEQKTPKTPSI